MFMKGFLGISFAAMSYFANATLVVSDSPITGADMAGIEVTAFFGNGESDTQTWSVLSTDDTVLYGEGFSGGVQTSDWSLTQQGFTIGGINPDDSSILGLWTLTNIGVHTGIVGFTINALIANIAFDTNSDEELTPNSGVGVEFVTPTANTSPVYTDLVNLSFSDLFGTLTVGLDSQAPLAIDQELLFIADTEKLELPEPSSIALTLAGLMLVFGSMRRVEK